MDTDLAKAMKAHGRRLKFRMYTVPALTTSGTFLAYWAFDLNLTQLMILFLGSMVISATMQIECRLKTIQVRLAWMHDQIKHGEWSHDPGNHDQRSKYPPAKPGALDVEPLKAALIVHGQITPAQ